MRYTPINEQILARAIAKVKGGKKPETYLRKMSQIRHYRTGKIMKRRGVHGVAYATFALRHPDVALTYKRMLEKL